MKRNETVFVVSFVFLVAVVGSYLVAVEYQEIAGDVFFVFASLLSGPLFLFGPISGRM